jgi:hypothetical protein
VRIPIPSWVRVTRADGGHVRIRTDAIDFYAPDGQGGTTMFMRGGHRLNVDTDITAALEAALAPGEWRDLP